MDVEYVFFKKTDGQIEGHPSDTGMKGTQGLEAVRNLI